MMKLTEKRFRHWSKFLSILFAGIAPSVLIVIVLALLHLWFSAGHSNGADEGFMSPLLVLLYGYPIFLINLGINLLVAYSFSKRK